MLSRISTGIPGLDSLIEGGIPRGFTVLVAGNPGTGKTILTAHFLYEGLTNQNENALYVSFSESKEQFYDNTERLGMDFKQYEKQQRFSFLDFASINKDGMRDAIDEVLDTIRETNVKRLVVDSFSAISQAYGTVTDARIVLQTILGKITRAEGVTNMLIAEVPFGQNSIGSGIEEFVADGIFRLEHGKDDASPTTLSVVKMRGTAIQRGPHVVVIGRDGAVIYQKRRVNLTYHASRERISSGIPSLDDKISGGLLRGTNTALLGAAGVGKTTFCFQFVAEGVRNGEQGIFLSLEESADEIRRMGESYGYDMPSLEKRGFLIVSKNAEDQSPDAFISDLADLIKKTKARRLVVDSLSSFEHMYRDQMFLITKRLSSLTREYEVTCMFTILVEQRGNLALTDLGVSSIFQNIILLRYVEIEGKMKRLLILLKMRSTRHSESILEFTITGGTKTADLLDIGKPGGISLVGSLDNYVGILTGIAQRLPKETLQFENDRKTEQDAARTERRSAFEEQEQAILKREQKEYDDRIASYGKEIEENDDSTGKKHQHRNSKGGQD